MPGGLTAVAATATIFLALGSNQGDRMANLRRAVGLVGRCALVEQVSSVYETLPAYVHDQPRFLNMALRAVTRQPPRTLLDCLKEIEREMGRVPGRRYGPRLIDLDILLYGDVVLEEPDLQVPHPRLSERPFVLHPLAELAPDLVLPGQARPVRELLAAAPIMGEVVAHLGPLGIVRT